MKIQKFLVQVECDDTTRWPRDEKAFRDILLVVVKAVVKSHTEGPVPAVTITPEEQGQPVPIVHAFAPND